MTIAEAIILQIKASILPAFKAGKALKDAMSGETGGGGPGIVKGK
jgi:nucleoid DNA-binding protein